MPKIFPKTMLIILLMLSLTQEGSMLFRTSSLEADEKFRWFEQWPFNVRDADAFSEETSEFVYNGSHVDLVIEFTEEKTSYQELASMIIEEKGIIVKEFSLLKGTRSVLVNLPTIRISNALKTLVDNENVMCVEPRWKYYIDGVPNDSYWLNQWGPKKIEADNAWNTQKGDATILVAVVDTGIDYSHPDLITNYRPLGYDWVNNDSNPIDDHGHGTHCAGIIAATLNNSVGIAGLAQAHIMAEKAFAFNGMGYSDSLANAIVHAANQGAKIISCSWGSSKESQLIREAIEYAANVGASVIAAAGNSGTNTMHYPAAQPEVIAVTATDESDKPASFTTYGNWVDIAAPGTSIYSTFLWGEYISMSGTSMACPHVAGVAALVWSQYPMLNSLQVRNQLLNTADDLGTPGFDIYYGYGRVNARKAVAFSLALVGSRILNAPSNTVYFLYRSPKVGTAPETVYDAIADGIVFGMTLNPQTHSFIENNHLMLESGRLDVSNVINASIVVLGGPCPQKIVKFYEEAGLAPLKFAANETHYAFISQSNVIVAALSKETIDFGHEDLLIVEVLADGTNLILVMYGFTWKGTWAGGIYFKEEISKNLTLYSGNCYLFHWVDSTELDGVPQSSEVHQINLTT